MLRELQKQIVLLKARLAARSLPPATEEAIISIEPDTSSEVRPFC